MAEWYVYIVRCSDDTLYTGISTNPQNREKQHNEGRGAAKYTRARRPVSLVYVEKMLSRSDALKREHRIKQLDRNGKLRLINEPETSC